MSIPEVGDYYVLEIPESQTKSILLVTALYIRGAEVGFETLLFYESLNNFSLKEWDLDFFESERVRKATDDEISNFEDMRLNNSEYREIFIFTEKYLQHKANQLVKKYWNIDKAPRIVLDFSEPEDGKGACFTISSRFIEFWSEMNRQLSKEEVLDMLSHELCHWYLFTIGENFRDSDIRFAEELLRIGMGHTHNHNNPEASKAFSAALARINAQ